MCKSRFKRPVIQHFLSNMYTVPDKVSNKCTFPLYLFYVHMRSLLFWVVTTLKSGDFIYAMVEDWNVACVTMCAMFHILIHSLHHLLRHMLDGSPYGLNSQRHWRLKRMQVMHTHLYVVNKAFAYTTYTTARKQIIIYCLVTGSLLHTAKLFILWLFVYPLDSCILILEYYS